MKDEASYRPFAASTGHKQSDFDFDRNVADELALSRPQCLLLKRMLDGMEATVWFASGPQPCVELIFFWDIDYDIATIAAIDFARLLEGCIADINQVERAEAITAMKNLKTILENGIAAYEKDSSP